MFKRKMFAFFYYFFIYPYYYYIFKKLGKYTKILSPLKIHGPENITIGDYVTISYKTWLHAVPLTGNTCELIIGSGTDIGHFCHIIATQKIYIEEKVLIADKVYISDNLHSYSDISLPIIEQAIKQISNVKIGYGSWIGENVCIIGASIGKHCVVGANAVVTKDIPDYSIVVGIPAKIIKRYNITTSKWEKTNDKGEFSI